jgi:hypothetical protein
MDCDISPGREDEMGLMQWLNRVMKIGYGDEVLFCPRCVEKTFVRKTMREGSQVVDCPYCKRAFRLVIQQGQVLRTEVPQDAVPSR